MSKKEKEQTSDLDLDNLLFTQEDEKSELDKIFEQFLDPKNIHHNTELNSNEITAFAVLKTLAERYDLTPLRDFIAHNLSFRVSKGRRGRKEWVKIASREQRMEIDAPGQRFGRFFGRRRGRDRDR